MEMSTGTQGATPSGAYRNTPVTAPAMLMTTGSPQCVSPALGTIGTPTPRQATTQYI